MAIFLAGLTLLLALAIIPPFYDVISTLVDDMINSLPGMNDFETAYWHLMPILVALYCIVVLPIVELVKGIRRRRGPRDYD